MSHSPEFIHTDAVETPEIRWPVPGISGLDELAQRLGVAPVVSGSADWCVVGRSLSHYSLTGLVSALLDRMDQAIK